VHILSESGVEVFVNENTSMVDGIGGIVWDGTVALCDYLDQFQISGLSIVELGCGTGLCGMFCAGQGSRVVLTDREIDLCVENAAAVSSELKGCVTVSELEWGQPTTRAMRLEHHPDVVLVCECACLIKQQRDLVWTINDLCSSNTIVLVTFDSVPFPNDVAYEANFRELMFSRGFKSTCVAHYAIEWVRVTCPADTEERAHCTARLRSCPLESTLFTGCDRALSGDLTHQHVVAFYSPYATTTCSRCHCQYLRILNSCSCRYHPGLYVCRKHPAETKLSVAGQGDALGYYGNGQEGWEALFWDCCGSEDKSCEGCVTGPHIPYG